MKCYTYKGKTYTEKEIIALFKNKGKWRFEMSDSNVHNKRKVAAFVHNTKIKGSGLVDSIAYANNDDGTFNISASQFGTDKVFRFFDMSDYEVLETFGFDVGSDIIRTKGGGAMRALYEIKRTNTMLLPEVLDNVGGLFNAYPNLNTLPVVFDNIEGANYVRNIDGSRYIAVSNDLASFDTLRKYLLYEVQHEIQHIEGFAEGGNAFGYLSAEEYEALMGETEARNVETRMGMTPEQRRQSLLENTEDVAREDQIFLKSVEGQQNRLPESVPTQDSPAFMEVASHPMLDTGEALTYYKNYLSDKLTKKLETAFKHDALNHPTGEPRVFYKVGDSVYQSYAEALRNAGNQPMSMGAVVTDTADVVRNDNAFDSSTSPVVIKGGEVKVNDPSTFMELAVLPPNYDKATFKGLINHLIADNIVAESKVLVDDGYYFKGAGEFATTAKMNSILARWEIVSNLGAEGLNHNDDGTFTYEREESEVERVDKMSASEIKREYKGKDGILAAIYRYFVNKFDIFNNGKESPKSTKDLRNVLLSILNDLGVSTMTMEAYKERYEMRHGVPSTAEALADLTRQVVAFAEGKDTVANISEELAHFIIAGYTNRDEVGTIMGMLESTPEWAEHYPTYYAIYSKRYQGEQLDRAVREEILGKILAKRIIQDYNNPANQTGLYARLRQLFAAFLNKVRSLYKGRHTVEVDAVVSKLSHLALNGEIAAYYESPKADFTLYSINGSTHAVNLLHSVQAMKRQLSILNKARSAERFAVGEAAQKMEELSQRASALNARISAKEYLFGLSTMVSTLDVVTKGLLSKVEKPSGNPNAVRLDTEDLALIYSLKEDFHNLLSRYAESMKAEKINLNKSDTAFMENTVKQARAVVADIDTLVSRSEAASLEDFDKIADEIHKIYPLSDSDRIRLKGMMQKDRKDLSWLSRMFGGLEHSAHPILGMLGKLINLVNTHAHFEYLRDINPFRNYIGDKGLTRGDWARVIQKKGGKLTGYFSNIRDRDAFDEARLQADVDIYNKVVRKRQQPLTVKQYQIAKKNGNLIPKSQFTPEQWEEFDRLEWEWRLENEEMKYMPHVYEERAKMYEDMKAAFGGDVVLVKETKAFLNSISSARGSILSKPENRNENGDIDYARLSGRDLFDLQDIDRRRKAAASFYNPDGTRKASDSTQYKVAQGLQWLTEWHFNKNKGKARKTRTAFMDALKKVESEKGTKAAYNWLAVNGGIYFSDAFWEDIAREEGTYVEQLMEVAENVRNEGDPIKADGIEAVAGRMDELLTRRRELMKMHKSVNNPAELNYENMVAPTKEAILEIEEELETLYSDTRNYIGRETPTTVIHETGLNEAYHKALKEDGGSEVDFQKKHMTRGNVAKLTAAETSLKEVAKGKDLRNKSLRLHFIRLYGEDGNDDGFIRSIIKSQGVDEVAAAYGRTMVLPYFRRFAPAGYTDLIEKLNRDNANPRFVSDLVERLSNGNPATNLERYLAVRPRFSWQEDEGTADLNPFYDNSYEGGYKQPKLFDENGQPTKYIDQEFIGKYGIDINAWKQSIQTNGDFEVTARRNLDDFEMLNVALNMKRRGLEIMDEPDGDVYLLPAIRKTAMARIYDSLKGNPVRNIGDAVRDRIYNDPDEKLYGEKIGGQDMRDVTNLRLIPKYGLDKLEDPDMTADDLTFSLAEFLNIAHRYKSRRNMISKVNTLEQKLLSTHLEGGKSMRDSNTHKMFLEFVDAYFYGIQRNSKLEADILGKKWDLTGLFLGLDRLARRMNLGFGHAIAWTSLFTAEINKRIENRLGEHVNSNSSGWATKEYLRKAMPFIGNLGKVVRDDRLFRIGELFRVFETESTTKDGGLPRMFRLMENMDYAVHTMANFPITPRIMLTVLDDFRLVGDEFMDYKRFRNTAEGQGTESEAIAKWNKYRDNSMYNLIQERGDDMWFSKDLEDRLGRDYLMSQFSVAQNRIRSAIANIDGNVPQEDKSAATRHFGFSFMMAHKGWLSIGLQRRFKREHFNYATGRIEEGHYVTLSKFLAPILYNKDLGSIKDRAVKGWNDLEDNEKINVRRVALELATYTTLLLIGKILLGFADDDDNEDLWMLQYASYIYLRVTQETGSTQAYSLPNTVMDVLESPIMVAGKLKQVANLGNLSLAPVEGGTYDGMPKIYKTLAKQTYLKQLHNALDIRNHSNSWRYFNRGLFFPLANQPKKDVEFEEDFNAE